MTNSKSATLTILLHGVGSSGGDIGGLAEAWRPALPEVAFEAPDAPHRFEHGGGGFQWFSITGVTEANRPQRVAAARAAFDAVLQALVDKHGLAAHLDRVILVGFSQGSIMALDAVASGRWPVAGVVAYSGRLASPEPLEPAMASRVLLVHGSADQMIPAAETPRAAERLRALGLEVDTQILPGVGHTITRDGAEAGARFIAGLAKS